MDTLTIKFINQLISDTTNDKLQWVDLFVYTDAHDLSELPGFEYVFFQNEFRKINLVKSYICQTYHFVLAIINETFYSGKDGTVTMKTNLYLSKDQFTHPELLEIPEDLKKQLIEAASKSNYNFRNGEVSGYNGQSSYIMNAYLRDHEPHEKSS